jgi:hypothetical protein
MNFLESFFSFGDLDEGSITGTKTFDEDEAIVKSGNTGSGFFDPLSVLSGGSFSFSSSFIHGGVGINDKFFISGDIFFELSFSWVENKIEHVGGNSDVFLSFSNSLSDSSFPFVMFSFFDAKIKGFNFVFKSDVSVEVLESLKEISHWGSSGGLEFNKSVSDFSPVTFNGVKSGSESTQFRLRVSSNSHGTGDS